VGESEKGPRPHGGWRGYLLASLVAAAVVAGRLSLDGWFGHNHNRHLVFLPTVTIAAWLWGFGPGMLATGIFTVALRVFWNNPSEGFLRANSDIFLFMLVSGGACAVIQSLHDARRRADEETRVREQVLAVVAHDLRNPLNAVTLSIDRLRAAARNGQPLDRGLETIRRATSRMNALIRDLVDATHIEQGNLLVALKPEPVAGLVQEVTDLFASAAQGQNVTLETSAPPGDVLVTCDRERLMQVLGNLMGNALKFTPPGGRVSLRATESGPGVRFEVEDTGRGIEPIYLPHIFERYRTYEGGGTGLGLFISQRLVELQGGKLQVESVVGSGSRFWFEVPRAR
jgi:signal transduction histidine kinase